MLFPLALLLWVPRAHAVDTDGDGLEDADEILAHLPLLGAELGIAAGTACAWLGMTLGSLAGWWLGRTAGQRALAGLEADERAGLEVRHRRLGPLLIVLTRPVPLLAEAATLLAGATGMRFRDFLAAAALGNLAVALAWSIAGRLGQKADSLQWVLVASLAVPVAAACLLTRPAHHARR